MFGNPGDSPFMGDWDCDGIDTPGLHRPQDSVDGPAGKVYLRNTNTTGIADIEYFFGDPGDVAFAGDFNGDGCDTAGLFRPSTSEVFLTDRLGARNAGLGAAETSYTFPSHGYDLASAYPAAADLDGDGAAEVVLYLRDLGKVLTTRGAFTYGDPGDQPVFGAWNGTGAETVGVYRGDKVLVRDSNTAGIASRSMPTGRNGAVAFSWSPTARSSHPVSDDITTYAAFAINSIDVDRASLVTGDVGVNTASAGPTLEAGFELFLDQQATVTGDVAADSVRQSRNTTVTGTVFHNNRVKLQGANDGGAVTPLTLPVLTLPPFQSASVRPDPGNPLLPPLNVTVLPGVPQTLEPGEYGDVTLGAGASLTLEPGRFDVRSFNAGQNSTTSFAGATDLRIQGRLFVGQGAVFGGGDASEAIVYVGGGNGGSGLTSLPLAADFGQSSDVDANVYAPFGTLRVQRNANASGAFIGRDVWLARDTVVTADSAFANKAPIAFSQLAANDEEVRTAADTSPVDIVLEAFDPNGDPLDYIVTSLPANGTLSDGGTAIAAGDTLSGDTVTYTPNSTPDASFADSFMFKANDGEFDSNAATVEIRGPEAPAAPPSVATIDAKPGAVETVTNNPPTEPARGVVTFSIVAAASEDDPSTATVENDVGDLTFTITAPPGAGEGSVTAPVAIPPNDPSDPVRSASVTYDPEAFGPAGPAPPPPRTPASTAFTFEACGLVLAGPNSGDTVCDTAVVDVTVGDPAPAVPPPVSPLAGSLLPDSTATIDLSGSAKATEGGLPSGRSHGGSTPGVYFLVDTTGSMGGSRINGAKAAIQSIITTIQGTSGFEDTEFGLGRYRDFPSELNGFVRNDFVFDHLVSIGPDDGSGGAADVTDGVAGLLTGQGGDGSEGWFYAIDQLMGSSNPAGFDPSQDNVLVLIGDSPAHDPVCTAMTGLSADITEATVTAKLVEPGWIPANLFGSHGVRFVANGLPLPGLDGDPTASTSDYTQPASAYTGPETGPCSVDGTAGQASRLAEITGGAAFENASAGTLATAILTALAGPPVTTSYEVLLPLTFVGTLLDSGGNVIPLGVAYQLPSSVVTYDSTGVSAGTETEFQYTATDLNTSLFASETVFVRVALTNLCLSDEQFCDDGRP